MVMHFLKFVGVTGVPGKFYVENLKGECLGFIEFYDPWKVWVFESHSDSFYDVNCLGQIQRKLKELNNG